MRQCVPSNLQEQGSPELALKGPSPMAAHHNHSGTHTGPRTAHETWKQVAAQEAQKPGMFRRIVLGELGTRSRKPSQRRQRPAGPRSSELVSGTTAALRCKGCSSLMNSYIPGNRAWQGGWGVGPAATDGLK